MSTPFEIESFEEYLQTVRNELPDSRNIPRPNQARHGRLPAQAINRALRSPQERTFRERDELEREVLEVFNNHLVTHVQHLPRTDWEASPSPSTTGCQPGSWTGRPTRW